MATEPTAAGNTAEGPPVQGQESRAESGWRRFWRYSRPLLAPVLIQVLLVGALFQPLWGWLESEDRFDRAALREWLEEARTPEQNLADLVADYESRAHAYAVAKERAEAWEQLVSDNGGIAPAGMEEPAAPGPLLFQAAIARQNIAQHLRALTEPTKMFQGVLLLFPVVYRIEVTFALADRPEGALTFEEGEHLGDPVVWDSGQQPGADQYRKANIPLRGHGQVTVRFQVHAENKRYRDDLKKARRLRQLSLLAVAATGLGLAWLLLIQSTERERERQRRLAQEKISQAELQLMQEERRHADTERQLLQQRLATQAAERQALELKSHLYASIGIMAGSYAHNIKNLLVRPNDLLRRCLETDKVPVEHERMLREVQQTLGMVTERLQQILHTVRRDPSQSHSVCLDLNVVLRGIGRTWGDLAAERWQLDLTLELADTPVLVCGDVSHLQQAIENLLFNARDATFEMRNHHRDLARRTTGMDPIARRQALIQAAAWRGKVVLRTRRHATSAPTEAVLEVTDNGAGMTEDVKKRCIETHFSTKRDNALFEGHSTGMGLGLSFVMAILEQHQGKLEIDSQPLRGTTFRARLPAAVDAAEAKAS